MVFSRHFLKACLTSVTSIIVLSMVVGVSYLRLCMNCRAVFPISCGNRTFPDDILYCFSDDPSPNISRRGCVVRGVP